ncbi:flavodoxin family protein [Rhodohalobacter barkolensis]|uniref:Flavodoxin n=1 Tax=Rhodohalobacter barkolensis TaxID=2053187 RepID=A0A2N0VHL0_9BACT|nr:flavodoxin family protein [Rhodohalobacter barkolensis]PKD43682.1 flavodoxin [Rhodohalobacter barkolensis]
MIKYVLLLIFFFWSNQGFAQKTVLIAYHSETGNTEVMAQSVEKGALSVDGVSVVLKSVDDVSNEDLISADAIIVGSPVYNANVTPEISAFIASWPFEVQPLKDKIGAAFVTAGGISAGEEIVQMNILQSMLVFGMIVVGGPDWTQPFGASAVTGEPPFEVSEQNEISEQFTEKGFLLGERVAKLVKSMNSVVE